MNNKLIEFNEDPEDRASTDNRVIIKFGHYIQNSDRKEPIRWQVLGMKDNKALVVSEYAIDVKPYNTNCKAATWETCTLRKWLNSTFINEAFDINEQMVIQEQN